MMGAEAFTDGDYINTYLKAGTRIKVLDSRHFDLQPDSGKAWLCEVAHCLNEIDQSSGIRHLTLVPKTARIKMFASRTMALPLMLLWRWVFSWLGWFCVVRS
jgi:hypothetical protein